MSDVQMKRRWKERRKKIADEFFAGDEAVADAVLDALPYSAIPDWDDVAAIVRALAPLLAKAWDEGFKQGGPMHDVHLDDPDAHERNPYRKGETDDRR